MATGEGETDPAISSWVKDASMYSVLFLICVILFTLLFIGTKDKININFSKKSNRYVLAGVILTLAYIFRSKFDYIYEQIKLDAINPGTGVIGKSINTGKDKLLAMNDGYLGETISPLLKYYEETQTPIESNQSINSEVTKQLLNEGALGYLITDSGVFYSIKPSQISRDKYILESKIQRDTMQVKSIDINATDADYIRVYSSKKYVENITEMDVNTILVEPSTNFLDFPS